ncbi:dipeptidyl peptidase 4 [Nelusetta ayraudi]|uniref:dipeptidyl peptidase 4 n=1 Tax=Nelusetta ayraudi TaxID=303726 RepID=UPI003F704EC9
MWRVFLIKAPIGKILLALLGVAVVAVLIAVPTALLLNDGHVDSGNTFTLRDLYNSTLKPKGFSMRWISDNEYLVKSEGSVHRHNALTGQSSEFINQNLFNERNAIDYHLSADHKYVAFVSNYTKLWRHSFTATYSIYDLDTKTFVNSNIPDEVQFFAWAPEGNKLAYVWKNNVYIKTSPTSLPQQVSVSGLDNEIFNGIPDWVYEEEMFSSGQGFWWSPGGKYLAYMESNDTQVHHIEYTWFGDEQYPGTASIPYPKPGTPNPKVKVFVVDTDNTTNIAQAHVPTLFQNTEHYVATVTWATEESLMVQWLKRLQNHAILQTYKRDGSAWAPEKVLNVTSDSGWVGRFSPPEPIVDTDPNVFYLLMSNSDGYKHIHRVVDAEVTVVTSGKWEVIDILKVTDDSIYFSSNEMDDKPGGRNVYRQVILSDTHHRLTCLTCTFKGESCQYNSAYFSHKASFYQMSCRGPGIPFYALMNNNNTVVKELENNQDFSDLIKDIKMPTMRRGTIKLHGFNLWYQMFLPPGFDSSHKYPLLIDVYAGPCSQKADYLYRVSWATYLASTENIIVASFDGRGSGYQGDKLMHAIYQRLGTYEVEDQITAAREFINMGFVDQNRVAIWGWSYGGYVTSMVLGAGSGVFKCGMAVAPVSKWEYYDTIYTERYMRTPSENPFYFNTTVTELAKNFHSVQYLLVHGTADDNVHFQQAAEISEALVEEQVDFEAMWYTDKDHSLSGSANQHVYTHMTHFLKRCFG